MTKTLLLCAAALALAPMASTAQQAMQHDHKMAMQAADALPTASAQIGDISIEGAYAFANPAGGGASAAFMTLTTAGGADKAIAADSKIADKTELHTHDKDADGVMRMHQVPFIPVGPEAPTMLQPGGYHVMFMGLKGPMEPGGEVEVTLVFEQAGSVTFSVPVRARTPMAGGHQHGMKHDG